VIVDWATNGVLAADASATHQWFPAKKNSLRGIAAG